MQYNRTRVIAAIEALLILALVLALYLVLAGCTPVQGFSYLKDSTVGISSGQARQAAIVAEAEALALRAIESLR